MSHNSHEWVETNRNIIRAGTQSLIRTAESLARSEGLALETTEVGNAIVSELRVQTESLERAKNNLNQMNDQLTQSKRILRTLYKRVFTNKFLVIFVIVFEIAILGSVIYLKFFKKRG